MNITAKLTTLLPIQTGFGKNGQWRKQDIIVETDGQYPKKICISIWGDKIDEKQLIVGNNLDISFELESREYNSKWYTDVKAWKIETASSISTPITNTNISISQNFESPEEEDDEDLPF
jgi:hypothetical protein